MRGLCICKIFSMDTIIAPSVHRALLFIDEEEAYSSSARSYLLSSYLCLLDTFSTITADPRSYSDIEIHYEFRLLS